MRFVGGQVGRASAPADAASNARSVDAATNASDQALRAHMAELGIVAGQGRKGLKKLLAIIADDGDLGRLPIDARASLIVLAAQLQALRTLIGSIEKRIIAQHRASE